MSQVQKQSQGLPYQGYPYVNPAVIDVPTFNPAEVAAQARWHNLPRRPLDPRKNDGTDSSGAGSSNQLKADSTPQQTPSGSHPSPEPAPVMYIDTPEYPSASKEELDKPVVYIDIPESTESGISQTREEIEAGYVQETIFYDQFKDRRITSPGAEGASSPSSSGPRPQRPPPPTSINLVASSSSGYNSYSPTPPTSLPPFMSKEAYLYGRQPTPDDGFLLPPIPVSEFPKPPPSYEETQGTPSEPQRPQVPEQPRTQVIVSPRAASSPLVMEGGRKLLRCQHCTSTVQTLVIRQNGFWTHLLAIICFFFCMPLVILIYCSDICKHKNHYCPACNQLIGYESPIPCYSDLVYARY